MLSSEILNTGPTSCFLLTNKTYICELPHFIFVFQLLACVHNWCSVHSNSIRLRFMASVSVFSTQPDGRSPQNIKSSCFQRPWRNYWKAWQIETLNIQTLQVDSQLQDYLLVRYLTHHLCILWSCVRCTYITIILLLQLLVHIEYYTVENELV